LDQPKKYLSLVADFKIFYGQKPKCTSTAVPDSQREKKFKVTYAKKVRIAI